MRVLFLKFSPLAIFALLLLLAACGHKELSQEYPHAVEVKKYRSWHDAQKIAERLRRDGLAVSIKCTTTENAGRWFRVIVGAKRTHSAAMALKIFCEDEYSFENVIPLKFEDLDSIACIDDQQMYRSAKIDANLPSLSSDIENTLHRLPYLSGHRISKLTIFDFQTGIDPLSLKWSANDKPDIPRGFTYQELLGSSDIVAELWSDEIFDDTRYTLQLYKLNSTKCKFCSGSNTLHNVVKKILGTRAYQLEKVDTLIFDKSRKLKGNIITITPRPNQYKYYIILHDQNENWLYVLQSPEDELSGMRHIAAVLADDKQDISLETSFYNSFATLPKLEEISEKMSFYKLELIGLTKERSGYRFEGCYKTQAVFHHLLNGLLQYELIHMEDKENIKIVFEDRNNLTNRWIDEIALFGDTSAIVYQGSRKANKKEPLLIYFATDYEYGTIMNYTREKLDSLDFIIKAQSFQLGMGKPLEND